jgi:hypothetical protein
MSKKSITYYIGGNFMQIGSFGDVRSVACSIVICVALIVIGAISVAKILKSPITKKQIIENNLFEELVNEIKQTNKEMGVELKDLKEKVSSIEKILKEVE